MYIFYDFETSSIDFLGQILSYSFILVDETYQPVKELNGYIAPNRLELPTCGAILTNKLSIKQCCDEGQSEFDAAKTIYQFLNDVTNAYVNTTVDITQNGQEVPLDTITETEDLQESVTTGLVDPETNEPIPAIVITQKDHLRQEPISMVEQIKDSPGNFYILVNWGSVYPVRDSM